MTNPLHGIADADKEWQAEEIKAPDHMAPHHRAALLAFLRDELRPLIADAPTYKEDSRGSFYDYDECRDWFHRLQCLDEQAQAIFAGEGHMSNPLHGIAARNEAQDRERDNDETHYDRAALLAFLRQYSDGHKDDCVFWNDYLDDKLACGCDCGYSEGYQAIFAGEDT